MHELSASNTQTLNESERKRTMSLVNAVNIRESNEPGGDGQGGNCPCLHEGNFGVGRFHRAKPVNEGNGSFPSGPANVCKPKAMRELSASNTQTLNESERKRTMSLVNAV